MGVFIFLADHYLPQ